MTRAPDTKRTNIPRYEPLLDCLDQEERRFLRDTDALQAVTAEQRDRYLAFQEEKLSYMVGYLAEQDAVLSQLGLAKGSPKAHSQIQTFHGEGRHRGSSPMTEQKASAPSSMLEILKDYCLRGMDGHQKLFNSPPRDKRKAKELLKKVKAAWRRKVTRKRNRQLLVDIPPALMDAIDNRYYTTWRHIPGNITKSRNDMLNEWLSEKSRPPRIRSPFNTGATSAGKEIIINPAPQTQAITPVPTTASAPTPEPEGAARSKPLLSRELLQEQLRKSASDKEGAGMSQLEIKTVTVVATKKQPSPLDERVADNDMQDDQSS